MFKKLTQSMSMSHLILFLLLVQFSYSQEYKISGSVTSADNLPIANADVVIENMNISTATDKNGLFVIKDLPVGDYTLKIDASDFKPHFQKIKIIDSDLKFSIILYPILEKIDKVEIFGMRYKHPDKIEALTRLPLMPYEQIQSISVIGEKLIEQQGNLTISGAIRNVPGLYTFATYGNLRESISTRGFRGIPILKNGVRVNSDFRGQGFLSDMQGVDNIQVLKGSASITQGLATDIGSPGGVINIVTKTPKYYSGGQASLRIGSYGQVRHTFDIYGPLNKSKNLAFRVDGALQRADSYRTQIDMQRFYINPSLEWKIDDKTKLTLEMDYLDDSRVPDIGTINLAENDVNAILDLPYDKYLGYENDRHITKNATYSIRLSRELSDKLSINAAYFASKLDYDGKTARLGSMTKRAIKDDNGKKIYNQRERSYRIFGRSDDNSVLQFDLIGSKIKTGAISHTFQAGFDYRTTEFSSFDKTSVEHDTIDVFKKISYKLPPSSTTKNKKGAAPTGLTFGKPRIGGAKSRAIGVTAQDVMTFNTWLKAFLGIRYSTFETSIENQTTNNDAFNPLLGIMISPFDHVNLFASYTNSSYSRNSVKVDINGKKLGNERYDQVEAGIKANWLESRLRFNLTLFKLNNKNMALKVYDEEKEEFDPNHYYKGGNDQRQGIEVELTGRPLNNLEVITGYSYIDAQYKKHNAYVRGSAPLNTPKHVFNMYANYHFKGKLNGLSFGAGAYYTGKRPVNDYATRVTHEGIVPGQKPFNIKAFMLVNAQAEYKFNKHWEVRVLLNNLFDEIGYNAYRTDYINQIDPRSFYGIVNYRF